MVRGSVAAFVLVGLLANAGCEAEPTTDMAIAPTEKDVGGAEVDAEAANAIDAAIEADAPAVDALTDGANERVVIGVAPTSADVPDGGSEQAAAASAMLVGIAAGSGGLVLERSWSDVASPAGEPLEGPWAELRGLMTMVREQHCVTLADLNTVDGVVDKRPADLLGTPWSGSATRSAARKLVDALFAASGDELSYLSLGHDADRFLAAHPSEAPSYVAFVMEAIEYASAHPARPAALRVGVTWSASSWMPGVEFSDAQKQIDGDSELVFVSYAAVDATWKAAAPDAAASMLSALLEGTTDKRFVLEVAYTSSPLVGSSEAQQADFTRGLVSLVADHASRVPFLGVESLHDPSPEACVDFAQARGAPGSAELYAFWGSTGLRTRDGGAKASFEAYLETASTCP